VVLRFCERDDARRKGRADAELDRDALNWPRAKMLLGECGTAALGLAVTFLSLTNSVVLFPVLVAAVPLLDAVFGAVRRVRGHLSLTHGDR
jgi:UDP-GlcNAc:undecaprenyl-phosphate GlcNAc-1-phosphate transferase